MLHMQETLDKTCPGFDISYPSCSIPGTSSNCLLHVWHPWPCESEDQEKSRNMIHTRNFLHVYHTFKLLISLIIEIQWCASLFTYNLPTVGVFSLWISVLRPRNKSSSSIKSTFKGEYWRSQSWKYIGISEKPKKIKFWHPTLGPSCKSLKRFN